MNRHIYIRDYRDWLLMVGEFCKTPLRVVIISIVFCLVFTTSCSPDQVDPNPQGGDTVCPYAPYTVGSVFSFESGGQQLPEKYDVVVEGDTVIDGETWKILQNVPGGRSYVNCRDNQVVTRNYNTPSNFTADTYDFISLQTEGPVETTWIQEYPTQDGVERYIREVVEKGGTRTVNGISFEGVIAVKETKIVETTSGGVSITISEGEEMYWYAPDAGIIESEVGGGVKLTAFDLK